MTAENLRNELRSARDQLEALDKQISKDREKLLKLREDKKILLEKVNHRVFILVYFKIKLWDGIA